MDRLELRNRRQKRITFLHHCQGCQFLKFGDADLSLIKSAEKPENNTKDICQRCGKKKRIHSDGLCSRCYDKENANGICKKCGKGAILRTGLCDPCYKKENYTGQCKLCKKTDVLNAGLCKPCYKKQDFTGICRKCGEEGRLTKGLCHSCWDKDYRQGTCSACGHEGSLRDGLCSTCYKHDNAEGACKLCGNTGVMTDQLCKTCYDKEHYSGVCDSCGNFGVLIKGYCRSCYNKEDLMQECSKCGNHAILDHNGICRKCSHKQYDIGICSICAKERPIVFANMCLECYKEKTEGIHHYMRSSLKKIIERLLGKKNVKKEPEEIYLPGETEPFQADFDIRDLNGKWCPAQFFNSRDEWSHHYKNVIEFKDFYEKYLKPKNYIMFTSDHARPETIKQYLIDRGFLQPNGLPYGKKITKKPISKRESL